MFHSYYFQQIKLLKDLAKGRLGDGVDKRLGELKAPFFRRIDHDY